MFNLREVVISITNRCNLKCRMCDIPLTATEELSTEKWKGVITDSASLGAKTIVFSGGEPLLREDIFELIRFVKKNNMKTCITTNGLLIDEKCACELKSAGIDVVNVSLEGPQRIHDYLRGKNSFERVLSALYNLKQHNIESTIATMVSSYNYRYLEFIVDTAIRYGSTTIKFQPFNTLFINNKNKGKHFFINHRQARELRGVINRAVSKCVKCGIALNPLSYLNTIPLYLSGKFKKGGNGCSALLSSSAITSDGSIYPCWVMTEDRYLIGSIKENRFINIWNSKRHKKLREDISSKGCKGCVMSCYDDIFGDDTVASKVIMNLKRVKGRGLKEYSKHAIKSIARRYRFYVSSRKSARDIVLRLKNLFKRKLFYNKDSLQYIEKDKIRKLLLDITEIKCMFESELKK